MTERAELWNQSTAQERRMLRYQNGYGGFDDDGRATKYNAFPFELETNVCLRLELDYIFNALVLRLLLESSSPIPVNLIN
jgi:hypothetical protein